MYHKLKSNTKIVIGFLVTSSLACATITSIVSTPTPSFPPISSTALEILSENGQIVFSSDRDGREEIYITDGTNLKLLTDKLGEFSNFPAWSPDYTKIAFHSYDGKSQEIYVINSDGSGLTQITKNSIMTGAPDWSPDGKLFAFTCVLDTLESNPRANREVCIMKTDGSGWVRLTNNSTADGEANWSPDGTKIAFYSERDSNSEVAEVYVMNADGSNQTRLTNNPANDAPGEWSPDGTKMFLVTNRDGNYEIYLMNADGTNPINLTNNPADDLRPSWSPDGKKIVFTSNRDGRYQLYVMNADGSGQIHLINTNSNDGGAGW